MMTRLLPCPFCGGEAKREDIEARDGVENAGASYITCVRCWASTALHFDRKENLVSSWNDRHMAGVAEQSGAGAPETSVRCGAPVAPLVWMNSEHLEAYKAGSRDGIAWASPVKSDFYDVALVPLLPPVNAGSDR